VAQNTKAEIRKLEPYCYGQFTEGRMSPHLGRSHVHWLTGTASTMMVGCVEGILGLRPTPEGLLISPSIPAQWDGFTMEKVFRGKRLSIHVDNHAHHESGVTEIRINGQPAVPGVLPDALLHDGDVITIVL
jgi:cellobiose phosphorylase